MNKTIKVIDLINMIAKGEKGPKKIKHWKETYILDVNHGFITCTSESGYCLDLLQVLNDKVEIIEESEQEIDIQDIVMMDLEKYGFDNKDEFAIDLIFKINELVQAVKQLDNKIKEK